MKLRILIYPIMTYFKRFLEFLNLNSGKWLLNIVFTREANEFKLPSFAAS